MSPVFQRNENKVKTAVPKTVYEILEYKLKRFTSTELISVQHCSFHFHLFLLISKD